MKSHKVFAVGLGVLLLSGFFAGLAIAENDSLHVIMTAEDRHYSVGDTISVEVRVYDKGVLTDASNITISISQHYGDPTELDYTNDETGIYVVTYTVKAADNHHDLHFYYDVSIGQDREYIDHHHEALEIHVYSVQDTVDVSFNGQELIAARPGDTITATILVRTGDTPIPITGFDHLYIEDQDGNQQDLTYVAQATGVMQRFGSAFSRTRPTTSLTDIGSPPVNV